MARFSLFLSQKAWGQKKPRRQLQCDMIAVFRYQLHMFRRHPTADVSLRRQTVHSFCFLSCSCCSVHLLRSAHLTCSAHLASRWDYNVHSRRTGSERNVKFTNQSKMTEDRVSGAGARPKNLCIPRGVILESEVMHLFADRQGSLSSEAKNGLLKSRKMVSLLTPNNNKQMLSSRITHLVTTEQHPLHSTSKWHLHPLA